MKALEDETKSAVLCPIFYCIMATYYNMDFKKKETFFSFLLWSCLYVITFYNTDDLKEYHIFVNRWECSDMAP